MLVVRSSPEEYAPLLNLLSATPCFGTVHIVCVLFVYLKQALLSRVSLSNKHVAFNVSCGSTGLLCVEEFQ